MNRRSTEGVSFDQISTYERKPKVAIRESGVARSHVFREEGNGCYTCVKCGRPGNADEVCPRLDDDEFVPHAQPA